MRVRTLTLLRPGDAVLDGLHVPDLGVEGFEVCRGLKLRAGVFR